MKRVFEWHGSKYYYLGTDSKGQHHWLEKAKWDCKWYWGLGYVETFTNNERPWLSSDINSHTHFDTMFFNKGRCAYDVFKDTFRETSLSDGQTWELLELMKSAYIARAYSDMLHTGGAHYTTNPKRDVIINEDEYNRINKEVIPAIMEAVYELLLSAG